MSLDKNHPNSRLAALSRQLTAPSTPSNGASLGGIGSHQPQGGRRPVLDALEFMKIDASLSPEDRAYRRTLRELIDANVPLLAKRMFEAGGSVPEIPEIARLLGPAGLQIKGYGCAGMTSTQALLTAIELSRVDASISTFYLVHSGLAMQSIATAGTEAQREYWLPRMARYEKIGSFGLTEPDFGSNATGLQTTARKVPGGWILNGSKRWIGNATWGDVTVIWARDLESRNITGFLVEKGMKGFSTTKIMGKISLQGVENANIFLNDCFVPDSHHLSGAPSFSSGTQKVLESSRAVVAASAAGLLLGAYERALKYCTERRQFGKPVAAFQLVQERLMRCLGLVQACVLTVVHLGVLMDRGEASMAQIALGKAWCTKYGREGVALCRECVGGNGILADFGVMLPFVDMESLYTYEGTYDVNMLITGRAVSGQNAMVG